VAEGHGGDQFAVLAACAIQTSRILLGTSITSVFVRTAPTIAMAAATLDELTGGRFILGVGSSHKVQVEAEHGMAYGKPLTRVRETVEVIRRLLHEGRVSYQGETVRIQSFDLWFTPRHSTIPIHASAVSQKITALCGEIADGIILTRSTLATAAVIREQLAEGARRAGRDLDQIIVTTLLPAAVGETRREALDALRPGLAFYAGFFPRYDRRWPNTVLWKRRRRSPRHGHAATEMRSSGQSATSLSMLPALPERLNNAANGSRRIGGQESMCRS